MLRMLKSSRVPRVMFSVALIIMFSSGGTLAWESTPPPVTMNLNSTEGTISTDSPPTEINSTHGLSLLQPPSQTLPPSVAGSSFFTPPLPSLAVSTSTDSTYPDYGLPIYIGDYSYYSSEKTFIYAWDKKNIPPKDYQQSYCEKRCRDDKAVSTHELECPKLHCFDCECARPACQIYDICCPDVSEPYYVIEVKEVTHDDTRFELPFFPDELYPDHGINLNGLLHATTIDSFSSTENVKNLTTMLPTPRTLPPDTNSLLEEDVNKNTSQYKPKAVCDDSAIFPFLYIRSCPNNFDYQDIAELCEEDLMENKITMQYFTRVSDSATNVTYFNEYCAMCNGVTITVPWQLKLECKHYMHVYMATSTDELIRLALKRDSTCIIDQEIPDEIEIFACDDYFNRDDFIDMCNVTGLWPSYDADVAKACEGDELTGHIYTVKEKLVFGYGSYYKNIFCATCNMETYPLSSCSRGQGAYSPGEPVLRPFSMLLGFREEITLAKAKPKPLFTYSLCTDQEWPSPDGGCLPLHCSPGKVLVEGNCSTAIDLIRGLGYNLRMWLTLENGALLPENIELSHADKLLQNFDEKLRYILEPVSASYSIITGIITNTSKSEIAMPSSLELKASDSGSSHPLETDDGISTIMIDGHRDVSLHFWIDGVLLTNETITRDEVENTLTENLLNNVIDIQGTQNLSLTFRATAVIGKFDSGTGTFCEDVRANNPHAICLTQDFWFISDFGSFEFLFSSHLFLNVTNVLNCRYVSFKPSQFIIETEDTASSPIAIIRIDLNITILNISDPSELNMLSLDRDNTLNVCHTLLDKKLKDLEKDCQQQTSETNASTLAQYILTLVCMGISMFCLALTLLTYFCFKTLRSLAGINNIGLSASLLLAQASLLASSHTEGPKALCAFLGILTHFLWLCMFTWSFICCFYMFRVFTAKTRRSQSTSHSQTIRIVKYIVLSLTFPAIVVIAVVVASYFLSGGSKIGYGNKNCYLDSAMLVGLAVVGPLALITVSNLAFFIVTIVKIHKVRKLQHSDSFKKDDQQNLYVYIKLSSMTGAFWAIFILAEGLDIDALRFVAIILNGLQGVFIFVSYICNKRVVNLYLRSMGIKSKENQSTTARSTLGRLASEIHRQTGPEGTNDKRAPHHSERGEYAHTSSKQQSEEVLNEAHDKCGDHQCISSRAPNGCNGIYSTADKETRQGASLED